jgi:hypothetical protein
MSKSPPKLTRGIGEGRGGRGEERGGRDGGRREGQRDGGTEGRRERGRLSIIYVKICKSKKGLYS